MDSITALKEEPLPISERWEIVDAYFTDAFDLSKAKTHFTVKYLGENKALDVTVWANSTSTMASESSIYYIISSGIEEGDLSKGETFDLELEHYTKRISISWDMQSYHETSLDNMLITTFDFEELPAK